MIQEVQKLAQESKNYNSNSEDLSLQEMAEMVRKMPKLNELMKNYNTHIELANEIIS